MAKAASRTTMDMSTMGRAKLKKLLIQTLIDELTDDSVELSLIASQQLASAIAMNAAIDWNRKSKIQSKKKKQPKQLKVQRLYPEKVLFIGEENDMQFRDMFKMNRSAFEKLCQEVGPQLACRRLSVERKMLMTLWVLCTEETMREIGKRFGCNKGSVSRITQQVFETLTEMRSSFIQWPSSDQLKTLAQDFEERHKVPGVMGVLHCTEVRITQPTENKEMYRNRTGEFSMMLQVVCGADLRFLDVATGWPGSLSGSQVFRNSALREDLEDSLPLQFHLIGGDGDSRPVPYLLTPFPGKDLTPVEERFNQAHARCMTDAKRAVGLLKGKFRRLKLLDMKNKFASIPFVIFATCVLHNFIIQHCGVDEEDMDLEGVENVPGSDHAYAVSATESGDGDIVDQDMEAPEEESSDSESEEGQARREEKLLLATKKRLSIARLLSSSSE